MLLVFQIEAWVYLAVNVALLGVKTYALINSLMWSKEAYDAAGKLTKVGWVVILAVGLALQALFFRVSPINLLSLAFTVAACVYLADVKPTLAGLYRR